MEVKFHILFNLIKIQQVPLIPVIKILVSRVLTFFLTLISTRVNIVHSPQIYRSIRLISILIAYPFKQFYLLFLYRIYHPWHIHYIVLLCQMHLGNPTHCHSIKPLRFLYALRYTLSPQPSPRRLRWPINNINIIIIFHHIIALSYLLKLVHLLIRKHKKLRFFPSHILNNILSLLTYHFGRIYTYERVLFIQSPYQSILLALSHFLRLFQKF